MNVKSKEIVTDNFIWGGEGEEKASIGKKVSSFLW
jgi:hypothetical protein